MDGQDLCRTGGTVYLDKEGNETPLAKQETNDKGAVSRSASTNKKEVKTDDR